MSRVRVPDGVPQNGVSQEHRSFLYPGDMVKLADTGDLKSPVFGLAGSSPAIPTILNTSFNTEAGAFLLPHGGSKALAARAFPDIFPKRYPEIVSFPIT